MPVHTCRFQAVYLLPRERSSRSLSVSTSPMARSCSSSASVRASTSRARTCGSASDKVTWTSSSSARPRRQAKSTSRPFAVLHAASAAGQHGEDRHYEESHRSGMSVVVLDDRARASAGRGGCLLRAGAGGTSLSQTIGAGAAGGDRGAACDSCAACAGHGSTGRGRGTAKSGHSAGGKRATRSDDPAKGCVAAGSRRATRDRLAARSSDSTHGN